MTCKMNDLEIRVKFVFSPDVPFVVDWAQSIN